MLSIAITPEAQSHFSHNDGSIRKFDDLPKKLALRAEKVFTLLGENNLTVFRYEHRQFFSPDMEVNSYHQGLTLNIFDEDLIQEILEVFDDLDWYLGRHIYPKMPGDVLCLEYICIDCGSDQIMSIGDVCGNLTCTSHERLARIHDEYKKPDVFGRAFMGLPKTGDANSWAKKC